jgi:general secretion pathway protein M
MNAVSAPGATHALAARWAALAPRERRLLTLAAAVIGVALVWAVAIAPALHTLRTAPEAQAALDAQWQAMQREAAEAQRLRAAPPLAPGLAVQALQGATERMGAPGRLSLQGERAVLTLTDATPEAITQWLAEVRRGARARPVEARLTATDDGFSGTVIVAIGGGA